MNDAIDCWFCRPDRGEDSPPGGWIFADEHWRAGHMPPSHGPRGLVMLESRRHFLDAAEMTDAEAASFGPALRLVTRAIKGVVAPQRVYTWASMAGHPHLHVWLVPWSSGMPEGPAMISQAHSMACTAAEATNTADRLAFAIREIGER